MTKAEFLENLRRALNGNMSAAAVEDNIQFYDGYFSSQTAQGKSESEILEELGDPRILARTLIDAAERAGDARAHEANETQYRTSGYRTADSGSAGSFQGYARQNQSYHGYGSGNAQQSGRNGSWSLGEDMREHSVFKIPGWLIAVIVILLLFVVVSVIGSLVWMILPYVIPIILVVYIVKLIGKK